MINQKLLDTKNEEIAHLRNELAKTKVPTLRDQFVGQTTLAVNPTVNRSIDIIRDLLAEITTLQNDIVIQIQMFNSNTELRIQEAIRQTAEGCIADESEVTSDFDVELNENTTLKDLVNRGIIQGMLIIKEAIRAKYLK